MRMPEFILLVLSMYSMIAVVSATTTANCAIVTDRSSLARDIYYPKDVGTKTQVHCMDIWEWNHDATVIC